jgi:perosamine synthetase
MRLLRIARGVEKMIPLSAPDITQREIDAVVEVMRSGVLSMGPKIREFERKVAGFTGVSHGVAISSGTSGLHLVIKAIGIKEGDEVITTPFSFISSTNCILYENAVPVFCDIDPELLEMDPYEIRKKITKKTRAILAVDIFGHPCNITELRKIACEYGLFLIEDACEAIGSEHLGIKAGAGADAAVFAFYPNKQITTGEGGCIVTGDAKIADSCRSLRNQGRVEGDDSRDHPMLGYNYRMSELAAAMGCVQMERIDAIIARRAAVAGYYNKRVKEIKGISPLNLSEKTTRMSWFVYTVKLDENINRGQLISWLISKGISCRPYFCSIHTQKFIADRLKVREEDHPNTVKAAMTHIALPFFNGLKEIEIDYIAEMLEKGVKRCMCT